MTNQENVTLPENQSDEELVDETTAAQTGETVEAEDEAAESAASKVAEENLTEEQAQPVAKPMADADAADADGVDDNAGAADPAEPAAEPAAVAPASETESDAEDVAARVADEDLTEEQAQPVTQPAAEDTPSEPVAESAAAAADEGAETAAAGGADDGDTGEGDASDEDGDSQRVVRMLAVGQQVDGVVRRITDFGAFVDIGVGRDGLIHISELSMQRVGKVSDVLSANQEVKPWIKKLDRKRNRISLTLIDPEQKTIRDIQPGEIVEGTVTRILPYGAFIDIGIGRDALLHVREMSNKFVEKPEDVVKAGETLEARIIEVSRRRGRVDLSLKGLRDEPEDEAVEQAVGVDEEIEEFEDEFADVEVLSPMELAFKRAVEAEGEEIQVNRKKGKKGRGRDSRAIQDEIIARTLESSRK